MTLTRDDIVQILGPVDDRTVAQVIAVGATPEELAEARAWIVNNESMMNMGRPLASGRVAQLVEILESVDEETFGTEDGR